MKYISFFITVLVCCAYGFTQDLSSTELLDKSIAYHDPTNTWPTFKGELSIVMKTLDNSDRRSEIKINLPKEAFYMVTERDSSKITYNLNKGKCIISKTDSLRIAKSTKKPKRSHCEMTTLYKNYYTYLYGLPMKLKDPGAIIDSKVERKTFKNKTYLTFKVSYDDPVGSDIWQFYFNPETYALEVYQFYRKDANGKIKPESGEYILLKEEALINNIKMPKIRAWYYNKNDKYLGTDILE